MDAPRDQLLAGSGLALDENGDRRTRGALHEREHRHHARRASDDVGEALAPGEVTAERSHLRAQTLLRFLQPGIELRVLDGDRDAARERFEEPQVRVVERAAVTVHDLQHPDGAPPGDERGSQDAVGGAAGRAVDAGVEPGIRVDVVHPDRTAGLERRAGDPPVRREPEAGESRGDVLPFRDDVREVELLLELVEEQHGGALGVEDFPHLAHDERDQLVDLYPAGERTAQVVEQPEAAVFIRESGGHVVLLSPRAVPGKVGGESGLRQLPPTAGGRARAALATDRWETPPSLANSGWPPARPGWHWHCSCTRHRSSNVRRPP